MLDDLERNRRAAFIQGESREALGVRVLAGVSAIGAQLRLHLVGGPGALRLVRARHADGLVYVDVRLGRAGA